MNIELKKDIEEALRKFRSPSKVARQLGVDVRIVLPIADELAGSPRESRSETYGGEGRPELRRYRVARKKTWETWNNEDPAIAQARAAYEAGTHTMCTGRDGPWLILYLIPQVKTTPRPDYFKPEF